MSNDVNISKHAKALNETITHNAKIYSVFYRLSEKGAVNETQKQEYDKRFFDTLSIIDKDINSMLDKSVLTIEQPKINIDKKTESELIISESKKQILPYRAILTETTWQTLTEIWIKSNRLLLTLTETTEQSHVIKKTLTEVIPQAVNQYKLITEAPYISDNNKKEQSELIIEIINHFDKYLDKLDNMENNMAVTYNVDHELNELKITQRYIKALAPH